MKEKCCGNCKHLTDKVVDGFCYCNIENSLVNPAYLCRKHEYSYNGWTEITPDTESNITEELAERIIIGCIDCCGEMHTAPLVGYYIGIGTMAKIGGYYYYVLPELKIE